MIAEVDDLSQHEAYRRAAKDWEYDNIEEAIGKTREFVEEILAEWRGWQGVEKFYWKPMEFEPIRRTWFDWQRHRFTTLPKLVGRIEASFFANFCKLQACTEIAGHEQGYPEEMEDLPEEERVKLWEWMCDNDIDQQPWSDFGLKPLAHWLGCSLRAEVDQKVPYLDRFLNTVHQRGDLSAFFIEGGAKSLTKLSEL